MRRHAPAIAAAARPSAERPSADGPSAERPGAIDLVCPMPGLFRIAVRAGDLVRPGGVLGELEILGQLVRVVVPDGVRGAVAAVRDDGLARPAVDFGAVLVTIDPHALAAEAGAAAAAGSPAAPGEAAVAGRVFRAPTSGRFYGRPGPDKPPFVAAGAELAPGTTICLLEVMKTFHRVTYGGEPARVREVLVADGTDVSAGEPLLALE